MTLRCQFDSNFRQCALVFQCPSKETMTAQNKLEKYINNGELLDFLFQCVSIIALCNFDALSLLNLFEKYIDLHKSYLGEII